MASQPTRLRIPPSQAALCVSRKIGYPSETEADAALERAMHAGQVAPGCHLKAYRCDDCAEWHLSNHRVWFRMTEAEIEAEAQLIPSFKYSNRALRST